MKKLFISLCVTAILGLTGVVFFIYSGLFDVSASVPHAAVTKWAMSTTMHASVERRAKGITVPDLEQEELILAGVNDFDAMCIACHGAPGKQPDAMGQGLNPPAPDLQKSAQHLSAAELFWVVKNGIKMTGMPAWGATHDDAALWPVVALMTQLPKLDQTKYESLLERARGMGHHTTDIPDAGNGNQDNEAKTRSVESAVSEPSVQQQLEVNSQHEHKTGEHHSH